MLRGVAVLLAATAALPCVAAFPEKPMRILIPFSACGSADANARVVASKLAERVGQPVLVEARPDANGIIATELVAKAPADGYTLLLATSSFSINQAVYRKLPFDSQRDFVAIGLVVNATGMVLVAHPSLPARNLAELITHARANPDRVAFGSAGTCNILHLAGETSNVMTGVRLLHVP
ncbi:MAG: tripartite tricarboxylate transporter substrate-binding protein [Burkholderiales bacterium]